MFSYVESLKNRIRQLEDPHQIAVTCIDDHGSRVPHAGTSTNTIGAKQGAPTVDLEPLLFSFRPDALQQAEFRPTDTSVPASQVRAQRIISQKNDHDMIATRSPHDDDVHAASECDDDSDIDAMGVFGSSGVRRCRRSSYFGPSSTISLLSQARHNMTQTCSSSSPTYASTSPLHTSQHERRASPEATHRKRQERHCNTGFHYSIPPRHEADTLLESYWTRFHTLYPFLHRPSFTKRYLDLWSPSIGAAPHRNTKQLGFYDTMDQKLFHCLLNIMFALGSFFDPATAGTRHDSISSTFFARAKNLIDFDMLSHGNIFLVQALLLLAQYLQSTDMANACWNMTGLAIRVAHGIGLHHDQEGCDHGCCAKSQRNQIETEMRSRAWTGCILLDR